MRVSRTSMRRASRSGSESHSNAAGPLARVWVASCMANSPRPVFESAPKVDLHGRGRGLRSAFGRGLYGNSPSAKRIGLFDIEDREFVILVGRLAKESVRR